MLFVVYVVLTFLGLAAAVVFNVAYFGYVAPYMRRRRGARAIVLALFGLGFGHISEYCKLARESGSRAERRVAVAIRISLWVFAGAVFGIGALQLGEALFSR